MSNINSHLWTAQRGGPSFPLVFAQIRSKVVHHACGVDHNAQEEQRAPDHFFGPQVEPRDHLLGVLKTPAEVIEAAKLHGVDALLEKLRALAAVDLVWGWGQLGRGTNASRAKLCFLLATIAQKHTLHSVLTMIRRRSGDLRPKIGA